ncbi:hypothetical protein RJT34_12039 [Clitoria ternatea]|uniref:Uncharacterized protein n=1 Tax=Clitoria ternatea TaxID=43366 RepID=A0AAN9JLG6_CLITE
MCFRIAYFLNDTGISIICNWNIKDYILVSKLDVVVFVELQKSSWNSNKNVVMKKQNERKTQLGNGGVEQQWRPIKNFWYMLVMRDGGDCHFGHLKGMKKRE